MIESKQEISKDLEKALQGIMPFHGITGKTACSQRKEKTKREETQSREPPQVHHGRYYRKVFSRLLCYDEGELNRILSVALQTKECNVPPAAQCRYISKIKAESRENTPPQSTVPNAENESEGGTE